MASGARHDDGFGILGNLLGPSDARSTWATFDAGPSWAPPSPGPTTEGALWGSLARTSTAIGPALGSALRRELGLARVKRRGAGSLRVRRVHRLAATSPRDRGLVASVRSALLAGVVVELVGEAGAPPRRVLDGVLDAALASLEGALRVGSGGSVTASARVAAAPAILRVEADEGHGRRPPNAEALASLEEAEATWLPRLLATGTCHDLAWSTETRLPGARPRRLTPTLAMAASGALASLPAAGGPPQAPHDDLAAIGRAVPSVEPRLAELDARVVGLLESVPAASRHGDLWVGNLLERRGELSGIVDWDAFHPRAAPGTDVIQLLATAERTRRDVSLGQLATERPWSSIAHHPAFRAHLECRDLTLDGDQLEGVGIAWWATEVAGTLRRIPARGTDQSWLDVNVIGPLRAFGC